MSDLSGLWRASTYCDSGQCIEAATWRKSSFCAASECVEAGSWRKSSFSGYAGNCVEAGHGPSVVGVRDSADPDGTVLEFSDEEWRRFVGKIKVADIRWLARHLSHS